MDADIEVIEQFDNVDFSLMDKVEDEMDGVDYIRVHMIPKHGTVIYVKGLVEGEPDTLVPLGKADDEDSFRVAIYPPFLEYKQAKEREGNRC